MSRTIHPAHSDARYRRARLMTEIIRGIGADREIVESWTDEEWRVIDLAYSDRYLKTFGKSSPECRGQVMAMLSPVLTVVS